LATPQCERYTLAQFIKIFTKIWPINQAYRKDQFQSASCVSPSVPNSRNGSSFIPFLIQNCVHAMRRDVARPLVIRCSIGSQGRSVGLYRSVSSPQFFVRLHISASFCLTKCFAFRALCPCRAFQFQIESVLILFGIGMKQPEDFSVWVTTKILIRTL